MGQCSRMVREAAQYSLGARVTRSPASPREETPRVGLQCTAPAISFKVVAQSFVASTDTSQECLPRQ